MAKISGIDIPSLTWQEGSAPATPASTKWVEYFTSAGKFIKDDAGNVIGPLAAAGSVSHTGCKVYNDAVQSINSATETPVLFNQEVYDDGAMAFQSAANLTGTVSKNGTTAVTGSGTSFTTELTVGQIIQIPGTSNERRRVSAITDDTNLTVNNAFVNTASGQTGVRVNSAIGIPTTGKWRVTWHIYHSAVSATGIRYTYLKKNQTTNIIGTEHDMPGSTAANPTHVVTVTELFTVGDVVEVIAFQNSGSARDIGFAAGTNAAAVNSLELHFLGA